MGSMSFGISECLSLGNILQNDARLQTFYCDIYEEESRRNPPRHTKMTTTTLTKKKKKNKSASSHASPSKSMHKTHVLCPIQELAESEEEAVEVVTMPTNPSEPLTSTESLTSPEVQTPSQPSHILDQDNRRRQLLSSNVLDVAYT